MTAAASAPVSVPRSSNARASAWISCEGVEFVRQTGENRTGFVARYLNTLGAEGWELAAVHPLVRTEASYLMLKRLAVSEGA